MKEMREQPVLPLPEKGNRVPAVVPATLIRMKY